MTDKKRVAVLPGDDAAPEAVYPTLELLRSMSLPIEWVVLPDGETLTRTASREERERLIRETVDSTDTLLFGATRGQTGGVGYVRWGKDTYANVRPIRWRPGFRSPLRGPDGIDYVIVRENIEDLYLGLEGDLRALVVIGRGIGGFSAAIESLLASPSTLPLLTRERVSPLFFFSYTFIPLSTIAFPHITIFCLTARRMRQFKRTVVFYPLCLLAIWLPCVFLGVAA